MFIEHAILGERGHRAGDDSASLLAQYAAVRRAAADYRRRVGTRGAVSVVFEHDGIRSVQRAPWPTRTAVPPRRSPAPVKTDADRAAALRRVQAETRRPSTDRERHEQLLRAIGSSQHRFHRAIGFGW
jgi:hypothetical protein